MNRLIAIAALVAAALTPCARGQDAGGPAAEPASSGDQMVANLARIARDSGGRIGLDDGAALAQRLDALQIELDERAADQGGDWNFAFGVRVTTTEPGATDCDTITPARINSHSGVAFTGVVCVENGEIDGLPFRTHDLRLEAPLDGETVFVRAIATMEAADPDLLADGSDILAAMSNAVIADIHFVPGGRFVADEDRLRWVSLLDGLSLQADAYMSFPDPEALSIALDDAADTLNAAARHAGAHWGFSFDVDASQSVTTGAGRHRGAEAGVVAHQSSERCDRLAPVDLPDWTGQIHTWEQCAIGPSTDGNQTSYALRMSRETGRENASGSVVFAMGISTDSPEFLDTLTGHATTILRLMVSGALIQPAEPAPVAD